MSQPTAPEAKTHIIRVTFSEEGKVITVPENNLPRAGITEGDTVIWSFDGNVAEQGFEVRLKGGGPFNSSRVQNQISGQIVANGEDSEGKRFEYEIVRVLRWADGTNGGCMKPIIPP